MKTTEDIILENVEKAIKDYNDVPKHTSNKLLYRWYAFGVISSAFTSLHFPSHEYYSYLERINI